MIEFLKKRRELITVVILVVTVGVTIMILSKSNQSRQLQSKASERVPTVTTFTPEATRVADQSVSPSPTLTPTPDLSNRTVYLGMWTQDFWEEGTYHLRPEKLTELQNRIGKKVAIAHYYRGWQNLGNPSIIDELRTIDQNGWRPMLSANPYFFDGGCPSNGAPLYKAIAQGNCDGFLREASRNLKNFGKPVFLRFAWEMNIDDMAWGVLKTGSTTEDFIGAWRHFHDIAVSEGATNIVWVFSPNVQGAGTVAYNLIYPGDAYVDWVGLDGYNWGTTRSGGWQSFSSVFGSSYQAIRAIAPSKPVMLAEVNSTDQGGDKGAWYRDMLEFQIPFAYPQISAVVFYNENRSTQEQVDWTITASPSALNAFTESIKSPIYRSSF